MEAKSGLVVGVFTWKHRRGGGECAGEEEGQELEVGGGVDQGELT